MPETVTLLHLVAFLLHPRYLERKTRLSQNHWFCLPVKGAL